MDQPHLYSSKSASSGSRIQRYLAFAFNRLKIASTWSEASVTLVEVAPAGMIVEHLHETNFESAYVLAGNGLLHLPDGDVPHWCWRRGYHSSADAACDLRTWDRSQCG